MSAAVGADIASLCAKCGDVWHVVVAKVGDEIVKVICKECGAQHRYRNPAGKAAKKPAAGSAARPAREPRPVVERFGTPAVAADLSRPVRTYRPSETFAVADRVEHPQFGQGTVESVDGQKLTVFFAAGRKVLVHGRGAPEATGGGLSRPRPFDHSGPQAGKPVGDGT